MSIYRKWLIVIIIALPVIIIGLSSGCASMSLPPKLTEAQLDEIAKTHFAVSVGVEEFKYPVYSEKLTEALQRTGLFDKVEPLKSFKEPPTYIAQVEHTIHGTAAIPILTGLSLGLIPTTVQEEHGHSFSLTATSGSNRKIPIEFNYSGPTTLGWWAVILNMLPNRTSADVYEHARFIQSFAWTVVSHKSEITTAMLIGTPVKVQEKAAPSPALASTKSAPPQLEAPADGATLDNGRYDRSDYEIWDFTWRPVPHASRYRIYVKHPGDLKPVIDEVVVEPHYRKEDHGYVVDRYWMGWTWKVQAYVGDEWGPWSETRTFDVEPVDTDPPSQKSKLLR